MKHIILIFMALVASNAFAQKSLFETLEAHGEDAVYTTYYNFSRDGDKEKGFYTGGSMGEKVHLKIFRTPSGVPMGIHVRRVSDDYRVDHATTEYDDTKMDYYPLVSTITKPRESFLAIDNMAFFLRYFNNEDGSFQEINTIYVLDEPEKTEPKKKEKKGGFFKKIKAAAVKNYTKESKTDNNQKAIMAINLDEKITNHWKALKDLQKNYTKTPQDEKEFADIIEFIVEKYKKIDAKNDAYWKSPEGQKTLATWRSRAAHKASCPKTAESCDSSYH
jgi:hypothetical protein